MGLMRCSEKPTCKLRSMSPLLPKPLIGNPRNIGDRAQLHHQIHSGSIRKGNIADEQIEFVANSGFHHRADVVRHRNHMPATRQQFLQCSAGVMMIVDQQNLQSLSCRVSDRF